MCDVRSRALTKWRNDRAVRLDRPEAVHASVGSSRPGGRQLTDGLNRALVLQLTAEFQGFARDLHSEAANALVLALAAGDPDRQDALLIPYTRSRRLSRGNADPGALGQDFGLFGMPLWDDLRRRYPRRGQQWHDRLAMLNEARNGLAHADERKTARVEAAGWPSTLRSARRWRGTLEGLVRGMDRTVEGYLQRRFGVRLW